MSVSAVKGMLLIEGSASHGNVFSDCSPKGLLHMLLHRTVSNDSDLPFPDISGRHWFLNPIDAGFKRVWPYLLIVHFFYNPVKFGFLASEICSSVAADFTDRSSFDR